MEEENKIIENAFLTIKKDEEKYNTIYRVYFNINAIKLFPDYKFVFKQDFKTKTIYIRELSMNDSYNVRTISKSKTLSTLNIDQTIENGRYYLEKTDDDWYELIFSDELNKE